MLKSKKRGVLSLLAIVVVLLGVFVAKNSLGDKQQDTPQVDSTTDSSALRVVLKASDGVNISARPFIVKNSEIGVVISHYPGKDLSDIKEFSEELAKATQVSTIAVELRGSGSSMGSVEDIENYYKDLMVSSRYLKEVVGAEKIIFLAVGLSAQAAIKASHQTNAAGVILISPELIDAEEQNDIKNFSGTLLVASSKDSQETNHAAKTLFSSSNSKGRQHAEYITGGRGMELIRNTDLGELIRRSILNNLKKEQ